MTTTPMMCRHCGSLTGKSFIDLGTSPPSNAYLGEAQLDESESSFPLQVFVCSDCRLVQTQDFTDAEELFSADYAYFSGFAETWVAHCRRYASDVTQRFSLGERSFVVEVASNDGTLLDCFKRQGIPCLGIEPTASTASAARLLGLDVREEFLTSATAEVLRSEGVAADLVVANNVVAHVPDIDDFVNGCRILLGPRGVLTLEFPHLVRMVEGSQFDTIYHEHFSYLTLTVLDRIATACGLSLFDVEEIPTHGGSLRAFLQPILTAERGVSEDVSRVMGDENEAGVDTDEFYEGFQQVAETIRDEFVAFLDDAKNDGRSVVGYGAAAKGNTLLNFAGVDADLLAYVVDRNPAKQGMYLPGSRIPIVTEEKIHQDRPAHVLILPWNIRDELMERLDYVRAWGTTFVTAIPGIEIR